MGWKQIPSAPEQTTSRNFLTSLVNQDVEYPLMKVPGMTDEMADIQKTVAEMMGTNSAGYQAAMAELQKTIGGGYDPTTSPEYATMREEANTLRAESQANLARYGQKSGAGGMSTYSGVMADDSRRFDNMILSWLGNQKQTERSRQLAAAEAMPGVQGQFINNLLSQYNLAGDERNIAYQQDAALYDKQLQELLAPFQLQAPIAGTILNEPRYYYKQSGSGSGMSSMLGSALGMAAGSFLGPVGTAAGGALGAKLFGK